MAKHAPKPAAPPHPVGIKDIAKALGVSTGTVDRALHAKPGVNAGTRARVLSMAESLGYRPNLAARFLKSRKHIRISVHLPREIALFWDSLRDGIREAAAPYAPALHIEFQSYPSLGQGDTALFQQALRDGVNGLIIAPGKPAALRPYIKRAAQQQIPVVCVVTDAPDTERLASVSADPFTVGAIAGELMGRFLPHGGKVAFFTGWLATEDHAEKLRGFESSLHAAGGSIELGPVIEAHDDEREGYRRAVALLRGHADLKAIYVSTVNSLPVLSAADQQGRLPSLTVITTDLFPELVPWIRSGKVAATVYQRPVNQGRLALQALYQYLLDGTRPQPKIHVVPHLVMRSNLDLFLDRLPLEAEGAGAAPSGVERSSVPRSSAPVAPPRRTRARAARGARKRA